jgi:hypothetical protein
VEYVKRAGNGWNIAGDGIFVRDVEDAATKNKAEDNSELDDTTLSV